MKIILGIGHPKQVHIWKYIIRHLVDNGHQIKILASDKDITLSLLDTFGFHYEVYNKHKKNMIMKAYGMFANILKALIVAKEFKPDIFIAGTPYLAYSSKVFGKPHISTIDTEHANLNYRLTYPFTDVICTPSCFKKKINPKKHVSFNGYYELTYLHPLYFKPDPSVLEDMGLTENDKFIIMRLVSWNASHDLKSKGFSDDFLEQSVKSLEKYGRVYISSERKLSENLEKYRITFPPEKFHSALYYSALYIGDGGTVGVESAILGTPSIHLVSVKLSSGKIISATEIHGNFDELVNKYGILYSYTSQNQAMDKALEILQNKDAKKELNEKRNRLLKDKTDVNAFLIDLILKHSMVSPKSR